MAKVRRWRSRIVRVEEVATESLVANPLNWRRHPAAQHDAVDGALVELGWLSPIVVRDGTNRIIDGHLRHTLAVRFREPTVWASFVRITDAEEAEALAIFDPLGDLARPDPETLDALLRGVSTGDEALQELLADLAGAADLDYGADDFDESKPAPTPPRTRAPRTSPRPAASQPDGDWPPTVRLVQLLEELRFGVTDATQRSDKLGRAEVWFSREELGRFEGKLVDALAIVRDRRTWGG